MGCIKLLPGTHVIGPQPHRDAKSPHNLLSRGQTIDRRMNYDDYITMPLKAGQISLHHTHVVHKSDPNETDNRRIGIGVSYIPTRCRLMNDVRITATLVRGEDRYGHFDLDPAPAGDYDSVSRAMHKTAVDRFFESNQRLAARRRAGNIGI